MFSNLALRPVTQVQSNEFNLQVEKLPQWPNSPPLLKRLTVDIHSTFRMWSHGHWEYERAKTEVTSYCSSPHHHLLGTPMEIAWSNPLNTIASPFKRRSYNPRKLLSSNKALAFQAQAQIIRLLREDLVTWCECQCFYPKGLCSTLKMLTDATCPSRYTFLHSDVHDFATTN